MALKIGKYTGHSKEHFARANAIFAKVQDSTNTSVPNVLETLISVASRGVI